MTSINKFTLPFILLILGSVAAWYLVPNERAAVHEQLIGYPNSDKIAHGLRVYLLAFLCFLPFLCSVIYRCLDTLDQYVVSIFLTCFFICFGALFFIMLLEDFQDNLSDFKQSSEGGSLMLRHYIIKMPALIVFILPYSLMLSLLWALGKMSRTQEIVSIIQTGRGVFRMVRPLVGIGVICTLICLIFNYYWAPHADRQEQHILNEAKGRNPTAATDVAFQNGDNSRHWLVGEFPLNFSKGAPLKYVEITTLDENNKATSKIIAEEVTWSLEERKWTIIKPVTYHLEDDSGNEITLITKSQSSITTDWPETPHQIIKPGLKAPLLGVPGLMSWCKNHVDNPLSDKRSYMTHLNYRYAQPFICLITILLAAPLGIVFNRRGVGGGVAVAIFLCAGMIFCSTVFPTLGESGLLPPLLAAWATNILFTLVALYLFHRRMTGQPIYQTIKNLIPSGE